MPTAHKNVSHLHDLQIKSTNVEWGCNTHIALNNFTVSLGGGERDVERICLSGHDTNTTPIEVLDPARVQNCLSSYFVIDQVLQ